MGRKSGIPPKTECYGAANCAEIHAPAMEDMALGPLIIQLKPLQLKLLSKICGG